MMLYNRGGKLVGTGSIGSAQQGFSVGLSRDGNIAVVGGFQDNALVGAAWVFTRTGGVWGQQGNKLVGTGPVGAALQGASVAMSADGKTAIVGGKTDNIGVGAAWVFVRFATHDFNVDFTSDILWRNINTGQVVVWFMNGLAVSGGGSPGVVTSDWQIQGMNAD